MIWTKFHYFKSSGSIFDLIWGFGVLQLLVVYRFTLATLQGHRCFDSNVFTFLFFVVIRLTLITPGPLFSIFIAFLRGIPQNKNQLIRKLYFNRIRNS